MRIFLVLPASLLLTGCPSKEAPPSPAESSTPNATSPSPAKSPTPTATSPSPAESPTPNANSTPQSTPAPESSRNPVSYQGTWITTDAQGQVFDIIIYPNGQAVTNWAKGRAGARGERGYWRYDKERLTIVYSDGCTDIIEPAEASFRHRRYSAGSPVDSQPLVQAEATRAKSDQLGLVGVWRLNKEPDGSHLYIALQSNGSAVSTINGATEGKWKANEKGARCEWPDGWIDQIERGIGGWQKRSWIGSETGAPADLCPATRVGETPFAIEP